MTRKKRKFLLSQSLWLLLFLSGLYMVATTLSQSEPDEVIRKELTLDVGEATLNVVIWGNGETLVMLHGGIGVASRFDKIAPKIAAAGFRVIAVNRRGFAGSKGPLEGLTLHDYASDVAGLIKKVTGGQAHVLGHAYGNRVARCVASDYPKLIRTVILLAAGGKIRGDEEAQLAAARLLESELSDQERLQLLQLTLFSPKSDASAGLTWRNSWPEARAAGQAANRATSVSDWWAGGTAPMLVIQGLDDRLAPPGNARSLKEEFGDRVRLVELERAGHALLPERPKAILEAIVDFLREHPISKK